MSKSVEKIAAADVAEILIEDAADLTAKELAQERLARLEEMKKRNWMGHSPHQLAARIPVSVFAMGDLITSA
jgi:hypothetical protein